MKLKNRLIIKKYNELEEVNDNKHLKEKIHKMNFTIKKHFIINLIISKFFYYFI